LSEPPSPIFACPRCRSVFRGHYSRCPRDGQTLDKQTQDILPGTTLGLGKYLVQDKLGEGGAGMVYEAVDTRIKRRYALKVLYGDLAVLPDMMRRFRREAEAAGRLSHPNVAGVIDFGLDIEQEPAFLVMELAQGDSLANTVFTKGPLNEARARAVLLGITQGLAHAHEQGVLHRDLKPDNIILEAGSDRPRIVDFGVARVESTSSQAKLTHHGVVVGTPGFLAPEVLRGLKPDNRADLYGLGVTAVYMLTGTLPFGEGEDAAITQTLAGLDLSALQAAPVADDLKAHVRCLLAAQPDERPASALEFADHLTGRSTPSPAAHISTGASAFAPTRDSIPVPPRTPRPEAYEIAPTTAIPIATEPVEPPAADRRWAGIAAMLLLGLATAGWWWSSPSLPSAQPRSAPTAQPKLQATELTPQPAAAPAAKQEPQAPAAKNPPSKVAPSRPQRAAPTSRPARRLAKTPAKPVTAKAPAKPITAQQLGAAYADLGRSLEALESEQGAQRAAPLRKRYFDLPLADALRRPELADGVMSKIRGLARDVRRAQKSGP